MRLLKIFAVLAITFSLTSCFNTQEDLWINADGSGHHELSYDLGNLAPFIKMGVEKELEKAENDSLSTQGKDKMPDSLKGMFKGESIDTTIKVMTIVMDELAKEGKTLDDMKAKLLMEMDEDSEIDEETKAAISNLVDRVLTFELHLQSDLDKNVFKFGITQRFNDLASFSNMGEDFSKVMQSFYENTDAKDKSTSTKFTAALKMFDAIPLYQLDGKVLRIKRRGLDMSALGEKEQSSMAMLNMFMGEQNHRLVIHLPGKVKKISSGDIQQLDKKTIVIETPVADMYDPEKSLDATITFKRKRKYYKK